MIHRFLASMAALAVAIAVVLLATVPVAGQAAPAAKAKTAADKAWTPPRTADGHPDMQGIWSHNAATPLERPKELAGRQFLTDEELATLKKNAAKLFGDDAGDAAFDRVFVAALTNKKYTNDDGVGNYNQFWLVDKEFDNRTSLIVDPADGRIPALTKEGQKRRSAAAERRRLHPYDRPEDIALGLRCITGNVPMLGAGYNNYYQIFQAPGYVAINLEMRHDARMIPTDGRPHSPSNIRQWLGDSRGHWEEDTLVVDTTNFMDRGEQGGGFRAGSGSAHVTERFTLVGPKTLKYEVTMNDPETYEKPWTAVLYWKSTTDLIYEFACHEGNYAIANTLSGARFKEKAAEEAAIKGSK